jgi:hypothetical protein
MLKKSLIPALLLSFVTLTGCLSSGSGLLADMEGSGEIPKLDRSDSLTGPDTDNNGIRDDIDRYLKTVEASEEEKLALIQVARALQAVQASDLTSDKELRVLLNGIVRAASCVIDEYEIMVDGDREIDKLQGYTANTRDRTMHYVKWGQSMDGSVFKSPEDVCDGVAQ